MKLSPLTYLIIAISLSLSVLSYSYFHHFSPKSEEAAAFREYGDKLEAEANKLPAAYRRVEQAREMVQEIDRKWNDIVAWRTPPPALGRGGIDLAVNRWQLTVDARRYRNSLQTALNRQVKRGGVRVVQGPTVPFPSDGASNVLESFFNFPAVAFPIVIFDLGVVTVQGTLEQIYGNVRAWSTMPNYLAVTDGLSISGTAPTLTASYRVSVVGFIRGQEIAPPVPEAAASGGAGGAPGMPGMGG